MSAEHETRNPCSRCGHLCPDTDVCLKCGSDPMLDGDTQCVACDAAETEAASQGGEQ
ncbi:hypothetical protein [Myxococcus phage Mx4 ts27htf-1hrm-1]|nr:hypothetical protein Mx4_p94 [Myxococcus phage Mx4]WNM70432.1 hypothetical protein [Myxococcus phage Mx4 ts27htf-1hrm-1]